ncbi:MAG: right-handed parallel beta-helix repeat-containing protein [Congregibacter sp.]
MQDVQSMPQRLYRVLESHLTTDWASTLALCLALFFSASAGANDYWVAPTDSPYAPQKSVQGAAGTSAKPPCYRSAPCQLGSSLLRRLEPGDTLYLHGGHYRPLRIRDLHGSEKAPIIISADIGALATTERPAGTNLSAIPQRPTIIARETQAGGQIDTLEIQRSSYVVITGISIKGAVRAGVRVNNSHDIELRGITVEDAGKWGIYADYANSLEIIDGHITGAGKQHGIYLANSGDKARITRTFIQGFFGSGIHVNGDLSMGGASGVAPDGVISDLVFTDNWIDSIGLSGGAGINLDGAERVLIRHNLITNTRSAGVTVFRADGAIGSDQVIIERNLIVGAKDSRDLLIFNHSGLNNRVFGNVFISRNKKSHVIDVEYDEDHYDKQGKPQVTALPFESADNIYHSAGPGVVSLGKVSLRDRQVTGRPALGLSPQVLSDVLPDIAPDIAPEKATFGLAPVPGSQNAYLLSTALQKLATLHSIAESNPFLGEDRLGLP